MDDRQQVSAQQASTGDAPESTVIQVREIPPEIVALTMIDPDHIDCLRLATDRASTCSPEHWAHVALDEVAGAKGQFVWRALLGLRLAPRGSADHIAGWRIADRAPTWIRLEASGWMMTGEILVHFDDEYLSLVTVVRFRRRIAAYVWGALSGVHARVAPKLLLEAYTSITPGT